MSRRNTLYRRVRRTYDQGRLAGILTLPEEKFGRAFGMDTVEVAQRYPHDYYHFRDNDADVLAVAHLDTVVDADCRTPRFRDTPDGPFVVSGALDDRLGAYVILDVLPRLGVTCDWLLTVGEEHGMSTASLFDPPKKYNHVIEFDRGGTDVVMYQYENEETKLAVKAVGAPVGMGSFSDISFLDHLGVKAFNWGVGYGGNYHSVDGYAFLRDTWSMVAKYLRFHAQNAGVAMPHEPPKWAEHSSGYVTECEVCYAWAVDPDTEVCGECGTHQPCWMNEGDCLCYTGPELSKSVG